ncbi:hypothetical protein BRYFOR_09837 [Marvinbryantia formatexigens DSM 14469]|uniref:Uncharacterized protein n=1 Tax=Marvinbryantia formatexigens DSM 14469 TaxID=478749 RepID=C6LMD7_9FIRM|nr:hypothetical protein BRYFOR_09837 [Marvinbryantia formatexigens DSM 14469]
MSRGKRKRPASGGLPGRKKQGKTDCTNCYKKVCQNGDKSLAFMFEIKYNDKRQIIGFNLSNIENGGLKNE